jgi:signal transduction histidine kinase
VTYSVEVQNLVLDVWLGPVRDIAGKLTGAIGVATDVTESRRLQARIAHEDRVRALGTLAASVAHEINNPLTYVIGSVSAAAEQAERLSGGNAPELRDLLGPALIGTARIRQVTRDLGTFVRAEGERLALVDIGAVVGAALRLLRKEIEARAHLVEDLGECPPVRANEARLTQVLVNLLMNAWQALPEASPARHVIGVRTTTRDGHAIIEVWDSGPGVPEARREEIFNPFVTTKEIGQGTGLGLFVCRNIVDSLAGNITVHDGPAGGALFRVVLPEANPSRDAHEPAAVMPASSTAASRRSIVIIDDDDLVARVLATLLQGLAYEVRTVQDGREGLALLLGDESIDLAYCDIMMKGMTGIDIFEELQRRAPGRLSRLVFMTGGAFTERARDFVERHRDICVHKPFDIVTDARHRLG